MNFIYALGMISTLLTYPTSAVAQAKNNNQITEKFNVKASCEHAKELIEKAGNQPRLSKVDFDVNTQTASVSYNKSKTTSSEILKKIALAGFDNSQYMAPDEAYAKLPKDCQYPRDKKTTMHHQQSDNSQHQEKEMIQQKNELSQLFDTYFLLKDAFVDANQSEISKHISAFSKSVSNVQMDKLSHDAHKVWMDVMNNLKATSKQLSQEKDIEKQRVLFAKLAEPMYKLAQKANLGYTVYYQNCPMFKGGANWLSKDQNIKNPYYGNQMLTCGSTLETLKK